MAIPTQAEIEDKLRGEDLNTWLDMWRAEQGPAKPGALKLIAAVIPFPIDQSLRVLDVGCGPGDAGRAHAHQRIGRDHQEIAPRAFFGMRAGRLRLRRFRHEAPFSPPRLKGLAAKLYG